jgi:hypothetical protein
MSEYGCKGRVGDSIEVAPAQGEYRYVDIAISEEGNRNRVNLSKPDAIAFAHDVLAAAGHVPEAAPRVVEVTAEDMRLTRRVTADHPQYEADLLNARLTARAGAVHADTIPVRVIRRPVETAATIADPRNQNSDAVQLFCETVNGDRFVMTAGQWPPQRECARWSADGVTWHRRTATTTARAWTAEMIPGGALALYIGGNVHDFYLPGASPDDVAAYCNRHGIDEIAILPATLDGGK